MLNCLFTGEPKYSRHPVSGSDAGHSKGGVDDGFESGCVMRISPCSSGESHPTRRKCVRRTSGGEDLEALLLIFEDKNRNTAKTKPGNKKLSSSKSALCAGYASSRGATVASPSRPSIEGTRTKSCRKAITSALRGCAMDTMS